MKYKIIRHWSLKTANEPKMVKQDFANAESKKLLEEMKKSQRHDLSIST